MDNNLETHIELIRNATNAGIEDKRKSEWGFQQICNENHKAWDFMDVIPWEEKIQAPDDDLPMRKPNVWTKAHIIMHSLCGNPKQKYDRIVRFVNGEGANLKLFVDA